MILQFFNILGICVSSISGAIAAGRKKMDFFGVFLIATITALGGGTVRDVLLDTYPLPWVSNPHYLLYTALCTILTIYLAHSLERIMRLFLILDAMGLAAFVILGTEKALEYHVKPSIAIISGMVTGICGGMLRDILCTDIPLVLRRELYAVIALAGALLFTVLDHFGVAEDLNVFLSFSLIFLFRLFAIIYHIEVPKFDYEYHLRRDDH